MRIEYFSYVHGGRDFRIRPKAEPGPVLRPIVGNLGLTLLVGPNGSGKSTLASTLVRLLHHIDWKQERIPAESSLRYRLRHLDRPITVTYQGEGTSLKFANRSMSVSDSSRRARGQADDEVEAEVLETLLPNVICSVFSTRGEYPEPKTSNAKGLRHTQIYNTARLYGRNHYGIGSLSAGLIRLISAEYVGARKMLARLTGLEVGKKIKAFPTAELSDRARVNAPNLSFSWLPEDGWDFEKAAEWRRVKSILPWMTQDWIEVDDAVVRAAQDGLIYFNDVDFLSGHSRRLSLMTLSAGQKMLLVRLLSILSSISDDSLVIIEEPEMHLDPLWCGGLLELLGAFFGNFWAHLLITTQSPSVLRCFPAENIIAMRERGPTSFRGRTFLASEAVVADLIYQRRSLTSLDETVLSRLGAINNDSTQASILETLGEGPVRFLARQVVDDRERL